MTSCYREAGMEYHWSMLPPTVRPPAIHQNTN